jgi:phosphoglycolate phosphatase
VIRGIIYDCDGTIVDSRDAVLAFYKEVLGSHGVSVAVDDPVTAAYLMSHAATDVFDRYVAPPGLRARVHAHLAAMDYARLAGRLRLEPSILETLIHLRPAYRLGIATNRRDDMHVIAAHFGLERHVDVIVTAADVAQPKPQPDLLLLAASRLGLAPSETLVVGDTAADACAAAAAGMPFVAYAAAQGGPHDPSSPTPASTVPCGPRALRDHGDLPRLLQACWGNA